jgi:Flp pilus assembly protein TadG
MTSAVWRDRFARRMHGDQGAALVELSFVAPVLTLIFMGLVEYGMLYRDYLNVSSAAADGAKSGAIQGPGQTAGNVTADYTIIKQVRANLATLPIGTIDRIVVYKADKPVAGSPLAQVPPVCKTSMISSTAANCNVYPIANTSMASSAFVQIEAGNTGFFDCLTSSVACGWNPATRKNGPKSDNIEYLGVYIKLNRPKITGMIPVSDTLEVAVIQKLEPGVFD